MLNLKLNFNFLNKSVIFWVFTSLKFFSIGQNDSIENIKIFLGETPIEIVLHNRDSTNKIVFLNVHEDESTSIEAIKKYSATHDINYLFLKHLGTRRITFTMDEKEYNFDPNRIFTQTGLKATLLKGENYSTKAMDEVRAFGGTFLSNFNANALVIALHNNTDGNYSIKSYAKGGDERQNTRKLYINTSMDPDDFIYTTEKKIFKSMKKK